MEKIKVEAIAVEAIARARAQIAARIARFCKDLSQEEFEVLLDRMAGIQYKYDFVDDVPSKPKPRNPPASPEPDQ